MASMLLVVLGGYLLGSVPFGYLIVRATRGTDVRAAGSGSTGATNVTRSAGIKAGALTYLFDVGKGVAAVALMRQFTSEPLWIGAVAVATILGHMFPVFLRFKGGKGVATGVGVYIAVAPLAVLTTLLVWIAIFAKTRMVSLASIVATALVPVWVLVWYALTGSPARPFETAAAVSVGCIAVILKHHANIRRIFAGTESRFERSKRAREGEALEAGGQ